MKFECNCTTAAAYNKMRNEIHNYHSNNDCVDFEVGARVWVTVEDITVMVEHLIATATPIEILEDEDEDEISDCFTCYLVKNENDNSVDKEITTIIVDKDIDFSNLSTEMADSAKKVIDYIIQEN
jgi:hypothetical protein